jgi:hypothetical protein
LKEDFVSIVAIAVSMVIEKKVVSDRQFPVSAGQKRPGVYRRFHGFSEEKGVAFIPSP